MNRLPLFHPIASLKMPPNLETAKEGDVVGKGRFPSWLHRSMPVGEGLFQTKKTLLSQPTVCQEARCPNLTECWSKKTATFLVLGDHCTRACGFCEIGFSNAPPLPDPLEPERIRNAVLELGLRHVVVTQVARDDLSDGGAAHLVAIARAIRRGNPSVTLEFLTSDLEGNLKALSSLLAENLEIFNHNIETVSRLSPTVRHKATYERSLNLLRFAKFEFPKTLVKSGLMVGLGESQEEVVAALRDLKEAGCDIVTIGQYLQPSRKKLRVKEFVHPDIFSFYEKEGKALGIAEVYAAPFVRSSYNAQEILEKFHG